MMLLLLLLLVLRKSMVRSRVDVELVPVGRVEEAEEVTILGALATCRIPRRVVVEHVRGKEDLFSSRRAANLSLGACKAPGSESARWLAGEAACCVGKGRVSGERE